MTLTVTKANQKKPVGNKRPQDANGNKLDEEEDFEDDSEDAHEAKVDLIQLVHDDNKQVAELFYQYSQAEEDDQKQGLFDKIKTGLKVHAQLVEEIYYPLLPETAKEEDKEDAQKLVFEAEAGNYVVAMVLDVLASMEPSDDYFDGKMTILHGIAKEQTKREEKEIFEKLKAAETEIDFEELGANAVERKMELQEEIASMGKKSKAGSKSVRAAATKGKTKPAKAKGKVAAKDKKSAGKKSTKAKTSAKSAPKTKAGTKPKASAKVKNATSKAKAQNMSKSTKKPTASKSVKKTASKRAK
ncbi:hypothetical protein BH10CYA1_BH10CYA1_60300 [soil metagenome]